MILQSAYVMVDCPVCGRPITMRSQYINDELVCGHCRSSFRVYENVDGSLAAKNRAGTDLLTRAEQLLRTTGNGAAHMSDCHCQRLHSLADAPNDAARLDGSYASTLEENAYQSVSLPTVLLVEHRDEVFARIATDIANGGVRVIRAKSATEALNLCVKKGPVLLVANVQLLDYSGWLMADKLRLVDRNIRVWLYQSRSSSYDRGLASFLDLEALLEYRGDLLSLSALIVSLIDNCNDRHDSTSQFTRDDGQE